MKKYLGEEFLNKLYKDLHDSEIVMYSAQKSDTKNEKVERYLDRLENVTNKVFDIDNKRRENDIDYLKNLYYKKYVIKEEDIPESYFMLQEKIAKERGMGYLHYTEKIKNQEKEIIIKEQQESLDSWIEYLGSRDTEMYPTWFKYYVFQGMLKLGSYDKEKGEYNKRTKHTVKPFIEINREAFAMVYDSLYSFLQKKEISDIELETLLQSGNFGKLYSYFVKVLSEVNKDNTNSDEGIWKKYNQGSNPEILYNDIHGKGTDWCTAGGIETAKTHLEGGDFYVYYTKDKYGNYTCPRIAIRKEFDEIAEIRGIASNQNLESNMEKVVEEKLKEADFPDREEYKKKVNDMKMMTYIYTKQQNKENLIKDDLRFLYEIDFNIIGFGYEDDPRIEEILNTRNIRNDLSIVFECKEQQISLTQEEALSGNIIYHYGDINLWHLKSLEGLILPEHIRDTLYLNSIKNIKGLIMPKTIGGKLELGNLNSAEDLIFPQYIGGTLNLNYLISAENLVLPEYIGGTLNLERLTYTKKLIFPQYIGGTLALTNLTSAEGLVLPEYIGRTLKLDRLITAKGLVFPKFIGLSIWLNSLQNAEGLVFPQHVNGNLHLNSLQNAEGLVFPQHVNGNLYLNSLQNVEGLILPQYIGGDLNLNKISIYDKIIFPKIVNGVIYFKDKAFCVDGEIPRNEDGTLDLEWLLGPGKGKRK